MLYQTSLDATPPSAAERGRLGHSPRPQSRGDAPCIPTPQMKLDAAISTIKEQMRHRSGSSCSENPAKVLCLYLSVMRWSSVPTMPTYYSTSSCASLLASLVNLLPRYRA